MCTYSVCEFSYFWIKMVVALTPVDGRAAPFQRLPHGGQDLKNKPNNDEERLPDQGLWQKCSGYNKNLKLRQVQKLYHDDGKADVMQAK